LRRSGAQNIAVAVRAGMPGAVERLVRKYQDELFSYALGLLRDTFDAEEVVQDAFLRAHAALTRRYDEETCNNLAVRPWLYRITRNLVFNRGRARRARREIPVDAEALARASDSGAISKSRSMDRTLQARDSLSVGLASLAPGDRELLLLRFVDGLAHADIAAVLGMSEAAARGKAFRAARRLRDALLRLEGSNEV
jgi:RNA polymerase sigma factor (sigma-70 family)